MKRLLLALLLLSAPLAAQPSRYSLATQIQPGFATTALGDTYYATGSTGSASAFGRIAGNTTSTRKFWCQVGTGSASAAPAWCALTAADLPTFANKFIVQGTTDANLSGAQFLGALGTGVLRNTTTTGVLTIAAASDLPSLLTTKGDVLGFSTVPGRLGIGTDGWVLTVDAASTFGFKWAATVATNAVNVGVTNDATTAATMYPVWVTANTGDLPIKVSSTKLSFRPDTGILTATGFAGNASTATTAGTVTTAAQPTITSVGTLAGLAIVTAVTYGGPPPLAVTGSFNGGAVDAVGVQISPELKTTNVNGLNQTGLLVAPALDTASSNVANGYGVKISPTKTGAYALTNGWGLWVDAPAVIGGTLTNSYAAKFNGTVSINGDLAVSALTSGYLSKAGTAGLFGNSPVYTDGTNVSLGITTFTGGGQPEINIRAVNSSNASGFGLQSYDGTSSLYFRSGAGSDGQLIAFQNSLDFLSTTGPGTAGAAFRVKIDSNGVLGIGTGTAPSTSPANMIQIWAESIDEGGTWISELRVRDGTGNVTTLSPHNFSMFTPDKAQIFPWSYYSRNAHIGKEINVDMYGAIAALETLTGKQFIYVADLPADQIEDWTAQEATNKTTIEKQRLDKATAVEVEVTAKDAVEVVAITQERPSATLTESVTKYVLDAKAGKVKAVTETKPKVETVATGETETRLKVGMRLDETTGKFWRHVRADEAVVEPYTAKAPPAWIKDRMKAAVK